jgi:hypothetical protein
MLKRALGAEATPAAPGEGRHLFETVLASKSFKKGSVGPFDVHVLVGLVGHGGSAVQNAEKVRDTVVATLAPASELVSRLWPAGGGGLISAARFPVVLAADRTDYLQLVELLDHCERAGYSGWAPAQTVDSPETRGLELARTWEVQVFDLSHAAIAVHRDAWLKHGVGHYCLAFVVHRALLKGAWGRVPPWLSAGLIDELDIAAYDEAWMGQESWTSSTAGWSRSGWTGFIPAGSPAPAPPVGAPPGLAVTVRDTGEPWLSTTASRTRHWKQLVADLKSEKPASFTRAVETENLLPRARAASRCLMHLVLCAPDGGPVLTARLDRAAETPDDGMPDSDPLPVTFARALGGVPEVDRLEALDSRALLTELGRPDLIQRVEQAQAADALVLSDHRAQAAWLYEQTGYDGATREGLFQIFLQIEYVQQMAEWKALAPHLDSGLRAALKASNAYPRKDREMEVAAAAFKVGLADCVRSRQVEAQSAQRFLR